MRDFAQEALNFWRTGPAYFWLFVAAGHFIFTLLADWAVLHRVPAVPSLAGQAARTILVFALGIAWAVVIRRRKLRAANCAESHSAQ